MKTIKLTDAQADLIFDYITENIDTLYACFINKKGQTKMIVPKKCKPILNAVRSLQDKLRD